MTAFLNPWVILGWLASLAGVFFFGYGAGQDMEIATQAREDKAAAIATEAAASAAAHAISKINVKYTTIRQKATTEIRRDPIYLDCAHSDVVRRLLDSALTNGAEPEPAGVGKLPSADAPR